MRSRRGQWPVRCEPHFAYRKGPRIVYGLRPRRPARVLVRSLSLCLSFSPSRCGHHGRHRLVGWFALSLARGSTRAESGRRRCYSGYDESYLDGHNS